MGAIVGGPIGGTRAGHHSPSAMPARQRFRLQARIRGGSGPFRCLPVAKLPSKCPEWLAIASARSLTPGMRHPVPAASIAVRAWNLPDQAQRAASGAAWSDWPTSVPSRAEHASSRREARWSDSGRSQHGQTAEADARATAESPSLRRGGRSRAGGGRRSRAGTSSARCRSRPTGSRTGRRAPPAGSAASSSTTCADTTFTPEVIVHAWRSWTSATPGASRMCERTSPRSIPLGDASSRTSTASLSSDHVRGRISTRDERPRRWRRPGPGPSP